VRLRHRNFVSYIRSYIIQPTDVILNHTSVTFDAHLGEIAGTLMMGGQAVLLPPDGDLDMSIFCSTISRHQVTYLGGVPSLFHMLTEFITIADEKNCLKTLQCISSGGESLLSTVARDLLSYVNEHCRFYNYYGPAECTEAAIEYRVTGVEGAQKYVPIGRPMSNVHVYLLDEYGQPVIPGMQQGEIVIGGKFL
ncbi:unnamed protein product, partial [Rotaria sp. Silwood2]